MTLLHLTLLACVNHEVQYPDDTGSPDTDPPVDADGDGFSTSADCDDADAAVNPDAEERCDGIDDDCDGVVDTDATDQATWYGDGDGDGYGSTLSVVACEAPAGFVASDGDCDDADAATHPGAEEACTEDVDRNCDGSSGYADADADGTPACEDCDDADAAAFPGGTEVCDGADDDCDGAVDEDAGDAASWYTDADGDGYGLDGTGVASCEAPAGMAAASGDCDDGDAAINPGAAETCDDADTDEDCDGAVDDADEGAVGASTWYVDYDGDGYGSVTLTAVTCEPPALYVADADDCDDLDPAINPAAAEVCDGSDTDEDCDGLADDADSSATGQTTRFTDTDGDGYGTSATLTACDFGAGYAENADDCDDAAASAHPGATEVCADGLDNDCDGDAADCQLESTYDASSYDYLLTGSTRSEDLGPVALGDFDGDGTVDVAGGLFGYDSPYTDAGATAIWYGPVDASGTVDATRDALLTGDAQYGVAGFSMAAGDHDGDGADELIVGAYGMSAGAGATYILYGGAGRSGESALSAASDTATITGDTADDDLGSVAASGGDLDGDGTEEIVLGAFQEDGNGMSAGAAYVLYGSATPRSGSAAASTAEATLRGAATADYFGVGVSFVDDMDGDGLDELLVGAHGADAGGNMAGSAYLFLGDTTPLSGTMSSATADLTFNGTTAGDYAGYGVFNLTDLDGDGYGDAGVHGRSYSGGVGSSAGGLWLLSGGSTLSPTASATLYGSTTFQIFGQDAASVGDQDGDGINDLLVGAPAQDSGSGRGYLFYGPLTGSISSASADVTFFERMTAGNDVYFGRFLPDEPGDITGDGVPDIVVGGYADDTYATDAGAIYVWAGLGGE